MVKCVIQKIQQYDKSRFDMLKEVQHIQDVAKKHNMEKSIIEERSKNMMMDFASKQSKTRTQLNALESVLNRIKTSSKNVSKERILLHHQVQLVVNRVVEMLEECSHPSVQKFITGFLLGTGSGMNGGDGDVFDKNLEGKTTEQVKREKRAALIASVTVNTVLNGFRTVESECLEIINLYWRRQQDHQDHYDPKGGFFMTQDAEGVGDDGKNMNTKSIYPRAKRYTVPYGPATPHGALSDQLSTSKKSIQSTFPKVKRRNIAAGGGDHLHVHAQLPQQNGVNEPERFMTREELITSTVKSYEASNGGEKVE